MAISLCHPDTPYLPSSRRMMHLLHFTSLHVNKYCIFQIVLHREKEILMCDCEMCVIHGLLSKIPDDLPFETLITQAYNLYQQYSPDELAHEAILNFNRQQRLVLSVVLNVWCGNILQLYLWF